MTPEQLAEIEQRVNATPRGPWIIQYHGELGRMQWIRSDRDKVVVAETADHDDRRPIPEFIAHARTDVPALVAEVKRLTAERDEARAALDRVRALHGSPRTERHGSGCIQCAIVWPCPTLRALDGSGS